MSQPKGHKNQFGKSLVFFLVFILRLLVTFSCLWGIFFKWYSKYAQRPIGWIPCKISNRIMIRLLKISVSKNNICNKILKNGHECRLLSKQIVTFSQYSPEFLVFKLWFLTFFLNNFVLMPLKFCKAFYSFVLYFQVVFKNVGKSLVETHSYGSKINLLSSLQHYHTGPIWEIHSLMAPPHQD